MEINGIKIRDMKDVQDVLMALETIKSGIENLSDDMSENYQGYNALVNDISDSVVSQKELIEGISHLQMKAKTLFDNYHALGNLQKEMNDNNIIMLKKEIKDFDRQIKDTMSSVINSIDLSTFRRQVETLFNDKISNLENENRRLSNNNDKLKSLNSDIETTLKSAKRDMKDSIDDFNRLSKVLNWKVILSVGFGGMFLGAMIMGGWGITFLKDKIFKDEQLAISSYKEKIAEMESKYIAASELEKVAREYEIKFIHDKDGKYILMPGKKVENAYRSNTNWQVWKLY